MCTLIPIEGAVKIQFETASNPVIVQNHHQMHRKENAILEISLSSSASPRFQVVQDVQGQEIHLYADGSITWRRALDNPKG